VGEYVGAMISEGILLARLGLFPWLKGKKEKEINLITKPTNSCLFLLQDNSR